MQEQELIRTIAITTDDPDEAYGVLRDKRKSGERGWDMAEVQRMENPPRTAHKWCVFRISQ